jgi:nitrate/TMAO reductase-like tetraheme cytochrome c subunit
MLGRLWGAVRQRGLCFTLAVLVIGGIGGILFWGGFNWIVESTNKESFCIACHEMEATPYKELKKTIHFKNPAGVTAICSDCHVPKQWIYKMIRKIKASRELYYHFITGKIDTPEKFEKHRLEMAKLVWATMKATDSRECRNCHSMDSMDFAKQAPRARTQHEDSLKTGETCIDCHKGIAHKDVSKEAEKMEEKAQPESFDIQ